MLFLMACNDTEELFVHSEKPEKPQAYSVTELSYHELEKYCNADEYLLTDMQQKGGWIFDVSLSGPDQPYNVQLHLSGSQELDYNPYLIHPDRISFDNEHAVFWLEGDQWPMDTMYYWAQVSFFSVGHAFHPGLLDDILDNLTPNYNVDTDASLIQTGEAFQLRDVRICHDWYYEEETGQEVSGWRCSIDREVLPDSLVSFGVCLNDVCDFPELSNSLLLSAGAGENGTFSDIQIPYDTYVGYYARFCATDYSGNTYYSPVFCLGKDAMTRSVREGDNERKEGVR